MVGISAGVVSGLNARQKAYTVQQLTAHWKAPFDLLVLPKGTHVVVGQVADPNAIDDGSGGITLKQADLVRTLPGVAVAAPLVPLGLVNLGTVSSQVAFSPSEGIFQETITDHNVGTPNSRSGFLFYYGTTPVVTAPSLTFGLMVAVDPVQEAKLVGLDKAVVSGHYLSSAPASTYQPGLGAPSGSSQQPSLSNIPVLITTTSPTFGSKTLAVREVKIPFSLAVAQRYLQAYYQSFRINSPTATAAALGHFSRLPVGPVLFETTISDAAAWRAWLSLLRSPNGSSSARLGPFTLTSAPLVIEGERFARTSPVTFRKVQSPFPGRWPIALEAVPCGKACQGTEYIDGSAGEPFRTITVSAPQTIGLEEIGFYDPSKLPVAQDPLTHLPLVNYRPEEGLVVLSPSGRAINPPSLALPGDQEAGLFTPSPAAITAIQDVLPILGPAPVSSIRVKVVGADTFGSGSQQNLKRVADEIHSATGLTVEIVRGASPQQVLVHPGWEKGYTKVGWIQEEWVRLGAGMEILRQTLLSQDVILIPVLFGALVFALIVGVIGVEVRRKEYATLLAIGVLPRTVSRSILGEGLIYGAIVFVLALGASVIVGGVSAFETGLIVALVSGLVMTLALVPVARAAGRMDPLGSLKETAPSLARVIVPVSIVGMGISLFSSSIRRHMASLLALVIPGGVFYMMFMVEGALNHTFYLTALGNYILIHVSPLMKVGGGVAALLAILASAQIALRNAVVRAKTWAIGQAVGWPRTVPLLASLIEAGIVGLIAGLFGASIAAMVGDPLFGVAFSLGIWAEAVGVIVFSGLLAAVPASWVLARQEPLSHLRGEGLS